MIRNCCDPTRIPVAAPFVHPNMCTSSAKWWMMINGG
jgi:hypothetical protein